ncbi:MAG TPA: PPOX class F420-dependent oxidoreductase [Actinomycetota bacterium]|jgi:PPOX class probable F420-dependent enzyme|nr:PPOX class F420-dependent oxidoreductase [Actinomycetota bacterium]
MTPVRTPTDDPLARVRLEPPPRTDVAAIPGKYLSITSYRRDGSGVSTPVWFATEGDRLLVMTDSRSGKVKRIRRNPYVTIAPCSGRGKPKAKGMPAHAELLPASEVDRSKRLIERKYRSDLLFVGPVRAIQKLFRPEKRHEVTAIVAISAPPA